MKTRLFAIFLFASCITFVHAKDKKPKKLFKYNIEIVSKTNVKSDSIDFCCNLYEFGKWLNSFVVTNNTNERIYVEWENARIANGKIIFGDDSKLTMRNPKTDEAISSNSNSIKRDITSLNIYESLFGNLFHYLNLKKEVGTKETIMVLIPIKFADNNVDDIKINVSAWYEYETEGR